MSINQVMVPFRRISALCGQSSKELTKLRSLTGMAVLIALSIPLDMLNIPISQTLRVGVGFLVTASLGMLYGPVAGGVAAGMGDIVKFLYNPTGAFFPGFTLTAILGGVIYGFFFYKSRCTVMKAILSKTFVNLILNTLLNTVWLSVLYGKAFQILVLDRLIKNLVTLPVEIPLLILVLGAVQKVYFHGKKA